MNSIKSKTQEHWSATPIGTKTAGFQPTHQLFTKEYFQEQADFRFKVYSPWLPQVAQFGAYRGKQILEVGCGVGTDLLEYTTNGAMTTGLDLTPRHIELARKRFEIFGQTGTFLLGDAEHLPFNDYSFDFVYSNGVLHHTPETQQAVDEIHRVLKPGGETLIILYHKTSLVYYLRILLESGGKRFVRHILQGKNIRDFSIQQVLSASTDGEVNPLTKVHTRSEGRRLLHRFKAVTVNVVHLNKGDFPLSGLFPASVLRPVARYLGWYLVLRGSK